MPFLALIAPLSLVVAALVARRTPGPRGDRAAATAVVATWVGVVTAVGVAAVVAVDGAQQSTTLGAAGLGVSVRLDALSALMLAMISLLAVVIVRYSATYVDGSPRRSVFVGRIVATLAAVEVLVLSGNLVIFVAAWVATSLTLHRLLLFNAERRNARIAARKKFLAARLGDVLIVVAAGLLYASYGTGDLAALFVAAQEAGPIGWGFGTNGVAAVLLVVAGMLKSAQFPTHGWLVEVMETPTPVSALLHAGILNAGPFLVTRFAFVVDGADVATVMLLVVGAGTALFASVVLLTQPSVKVGLGYSSVAHMGFMMMVCGLGVYPAAMLHLVAHSFYKAHAFLSSGSAIDEARAARVRLPSRLNDPRRVVASLAVAVGLYAAVAAVVAVEQLRDPVLLALGAIVVLGLGQIIAPTLDSDGPLVGVLRASGLALGVGTAFVVLELGFHELLYGAIPSATARGTVHLSLLVVVLVAFAAVVLTQVLLPSGPRGPRGRALIVHLRNGFYANALLERMVGGLRSGTAGAGR